MRYGQASPRDLLRAKAASPGLILVSPGRRTCQLDRPERVITDIFSESKLRQYDTWNIVLRRDKKILSFPVTFQDFQGSVGRKINFLSRKNFTCHTGQT